jgi:hypothetical protein
MSYWMLAWLPEPITVFERCKFTSRMREQFPPFLVENGKDGNPLLNSILTVFPSASADLA